MTLQNTYIGATQDGTSDLLMLNTVAYTIPVTVADDGWLEAIEAELGAPSTTVGLLIGAGVWADDGGAPGVLIHPSQLKPVLNRPLIDTTDRWVTMPVGAWLLAGTYHLGVKFDGSASPVLRTRTGGTSGDGHTIDGGTTEALPDGDYSSATVTATDNTYSIRGVFVTEAASGITGTLSETEGADSLAASGTHTPPAITGTVTETEADDSLAASGTFTPEAIIGTLSEAEVADTLSASGTFTPAGISGTLAETEADDTLSASGTHTAPSFAGTLTETEADDTLAASGSVAAPTFTGTLAETEEADSLAAVGLVGIPITGTLAETEEDDTLSAFGTIPVGKWREASISGSNREASLTGNVREASITGTFREVDFG